MAWRSSFPRSCTISPAASPAVSFVAATNGDERRQSFGRRHGTGGVRRTTDQPVRASSPSERSAEVAGHETCRCVNHGPARAGCAAAPEGANRGVSLHGAESTSPSTFPGHHRPQRRSSWTVPSRRLPGSPPGARSSCDAPRAAGRKRGHNPSDGGAALGARHTCSHDRSVGPRPRRRAMPSWSRSAGDPPAHADPGRRPRARLVRPCRRSRAVMKDSSISHGGPPSGPRPQDAKTFARLGVGPGLPDCPVCLGQESLVDRRCYAGEVCPVIPLGRRSTPIVGTVPSVFVAPICWTFPRPGRWRDVGSAPS